jgi:hypothetical protein
MSGKQAGLAALYGFVGFVQFCNSMPYLDESRLMKKLPNALWMPAFVFGTIASGIAWPISLHIMLVVDWKNRRD